MKRTLVLLAAAVAAAVPLALPSAADNPLHFDRPCSGTIDTFCYYDFCQFVDCTRSDCVVYSGIFGDGGNAGTCVGLPRPGGGPPTAAPRS